MTRTERIQTILSQRQQSVEKLTQFIQTTEALRHHLETLELSRTELIAEPGVQPEVQEKLAQLSFTGSLLELSGLTHLARRLQLKRSRKSIHIGIVGQARQGKSRLLQSLTGLSETEVATSKNEHCTGVSARFENYPGEVSGEIAFHTERSFIQEVLGAYYGQGEGGLNLGELPRSMAEFSHNPLPALPEKLNGQPIGAVQQAAYEHLQDYHRRSPHYRELLSGLTRSKCTREEIRKYTAQVDTENQKTADWMAVRSATIRCPFPAEDIGAITLVDTPGLGDTRPGEMDRIFKTLREEVDFILFVRLPNAIAAGGWSPLDLQLYDKARLALMPIPIDRCSMMLLNRSHPGKPEQDNISQCEQFRGSMHLKGLKFVQDFMVDCANPSEVQHEVLDRVVDYLMEQLTELDQFELSELVQGWERLQASMQDSLQKAELILGQVNRSDENKTFFLLFDPFWKDLTSALMGALRVVFEDRDIADDGFHQAIRQCLKAIEEDALPTVEAIERERDAEGSYSAACSKLLDVTRVRLLQQFESLDQSLQVHRQRMHATLADALTSTELGQLTSEPDTSFL
jgi:hypothetical protein